MECDKKPVPAHIPIKSLNSKVGGVGGYSNILDFDLTSDCLFSLNYLCKNVRIAKICKIRPLRFL